MKNKKKDDYMDIVIQYIGIKHYITGSYPYIDVRRKVRGLRMRNMAHWIKRNSLRVTRVLYRMTRRTAQNRFEPSISFADT